MVVSYVAEQSHSRNLSIEEWLISQRILGRASTSVSHSVIGAFLLSLAAHLVLVVGLWSLISDTWLALPTQELRINLIASGATPVLETTLPSQLSSRSLAKASVSSDLSTVVVRSTTASVSDQRTHEFEKTKINPALPTQTTLPVSEVLETKDTVESTPNDAFAAQQNLEQSIELHVLDWLARYRTYPLAARRARLEGVVQLSVVLLADGRLIERRIVQSSGHSLLDRAALDLLERASPLPPLFSNLGFQQIELRLPIVYRMTI